jgi:hypothetical protein
MLWYVMLCSFCLLVCTRWYTRTDLFFWTVQAFQCKLAWSISLLVSHYSDQVQYSTKEGGAVNALLQACLEIIMGIEGRV